MERLFTSDAWNAAASSFIDSIFNKSGSIASRDRYTAVLKAFFGSDPAKSPERYTRFDVETFLARPSTSTRNFGQPISVGTRNQRLAIISSFFGYVATYSIPGADGQPTALLQRPAPTIGMRYGQPPKTYRALSEQELELFFAQIPAHTIGGLRDRAIFMLLLLTARRVGEVVSLNWGSISTGPPMTFTFYPKGHSREQRTQEMPPECYSLILRWLSISGRLDTIRPEDPLFVSLEPRHGGNFRNVGLRLSGHSINDSVHRYANLARLDHLERLCTHSFRHSSARLAYSSGADIRSIQMKLGHASLGSTDTYLRILAGERDSTLPLLRKRLGAILS